MSDDFEVFPVGTKAAIERLLEDAMAAYDLIMCEAVGHAEYGNTRMADRYDEIAARLKAARAEVEAKLK